MVIGPEDHNIRIRITVQKQDLKLNGLNVALCHDSDLTADCPYVCVFNMGWSGYLFASMGVLGAYNRQCTS